MHTILSSKVFIVIFLFFCFPLFSYASSGKPSLQITTVTFKMLGDTIPPVTQKKAKESKVKKSAEKPVEKVIKSVPKVRKQAIPVPVKVKPVIVKPKIIRPIIRVFN